MKKYQVKFYYHTNLSVNVEAENEKEALKKAEEEAGKECYIPQMIEGLQEDNSPDVEEYEE